MTSRRAAGTQIRTPPLVPDANYIDWRYTNSMVAPWTELNFKYGNDRVKAQVQIASYNLTDPGYRRLESNLGINQAFITLLWPEFANNENLHLTLTVGGFTNRYGAAGRYDAGKYETYLFGRTHVAGATVNVAWDVTDDWTFQIEGGGGAKLEPIPYYGAPGPMQPPRTSLPMWEPYPGPRPQESAFLAHVHLGAVLKRQWIFGAHFIDVFANDNERSTAFTESTFNTACAPATTITPPAVCGRPYDAPRPRIMVYGADIKQLHPWIGDAYAGFSIIDARNAIYLGDAIEVLHSFGGWQLHDNYFGRPGDTDLVTGKVYTALAQYSISLGQVFWHPQAFWGQGPDLILNIFGMYNYVDLNVAAGANPLFSGIKKLKCGARDDVPAAGLVRRRVPRRRRAAGYGQQRHELLGLLAAADLPHGVRDARADHDPVLALLRRARRPRPVPVQPAAGRRTASGRRQECGTDRRDHLVLNDRTRGRR